MWEALLAMVQQLHIFGYTARDLNDPIGRAVEAAALAHPKRFVIRSSGGKLPFMPFTIVVQSEDDAGDAIVCPAQTQKSECCATCALCWMADKPIAFLEH